MINRFHKPKPNESEFFFVPISKQTYPVAVPWMTVSGIAGSTQTVLTPSSPKFTVSLTPTMNSPVVLEVAFTVPKLPSRTTSAILSLVLVSSMANS